MKFLFHKVIAYHGNGYIGGIIMLHLERMRGMDWEQRWRAAFRDWRASQPSDWAPRLNDQDIFNAVFTRWPAAVHALPCEWNLQVRCALGKGCGLGRTPGGSGASRPGAVTGVTTNSFRAYRFGSFL